MFSPEASTLDRAAALRGSSSNNPRRRQRTASADSLAVRQTQAKRRKRSALAETTFDASPDSQNQYQQANGSATAKKSSQAEVNGDISEVTTSAGYKHANGSIRDSSTISQALADTSLDAGSLAVRGKGRKEKRTRSSAEDGVELTKTDNYVLTRDRGIPTAVHDVLGSEPWQARFCPDLGFALVLTNSRAIVWKYSHGRLHNHDTGILIIQLPSHSGSGYNSLPNGTLVHDAGAGEIAMLVLTVGGKITYYESVRAAAGAERLGGKKSDGLTGSIGGAFSNEHVTQICEAESDGFLLSTNMGRLFHLNVRDPQGRPNISTQHLRMPSSEKVGIFGSIRNAITGGSNEEIASMTPLSGRSRSSKEIIVTNSRGTAQLWSIARHGPKMVEKEWNLKDTIEQACKKACPTLGPQTPSLLDLSLMPASCHVIIKGEHHVMALASFVETASTSYFLVGLLLHDDSVDVESIHQIHAYSGPTTMSTPSEKIFKPTLLIPEPGHTAFIIFDTKIVLASLLKPEESPDSQLLSEAQDLASNYEECLYFSRKIPFHTAGCAVQLDEDHTSKATCDIMIHGFGEVRLSAFLVPTVDRTKGSLVGLVKSRLEQVVFYGSMTDNFLDFREEKLWENIAVEDVEAATAQIIDSILDSTSSHVPLLMPSMDQQLKLRSQAILDLNKFVQKWSLSPKECWRLLWAGEKFAAARAISSIYNSDLAARRNPEQKVLLEELIDMVHENDWHQNQPEKAESDAVRQFLTRDVGNLSILIAWAQQSITQLVTEGTENVEELSPLIAQAANIETTALDSAWKFREDHAATFGLGREVIDNGIYQRTYADMPAEPWTATYRICQNACQLFHIVKRQAIQLDETDLSRMPFDEDIINYLGEQASKLADCAFRCWEEQCRWTEAFADAAIHARATEQRKRYEAARHDLLIGLVEMSAHIFAANLAEKYLDMSSLALVTSKIEAQANEWVQDLDPDVRNQGGNVLEELQERIDKYFERYGRGWAHAFFDQQVEGDGAARMLALLPHRQNYLTKYLRSKKEEKKTFNKLAWINEVRSENDYRDAAKDLWLVQQNENRLWAKQVGLALTKLCKLAAIEQSQGDVKELQRDVRGCTKRIKFTEVQQRFYEYIRPLLTNAIDGDAELQLALANLGKYVKGHPTLEENLRSILDKLVTRRVIGIEDMIEALTTMSPSDQQIDNGGFADDRFYWSLWLLHSSGLEVNYPERGVLHQRLIWRRVMLQDDWVALNKTESRSDEAVMEDIRATALYKTLRAGYEDGLLDKHPPFDPRSLHPAGETPAQLRDLGVHPKKDDAYLARLAKDLAAEDAALEETITKGRLDMWWKGVVEAARADVRGERDAHAKLREYKEHEKDAIQEFENGKENGETQAMMLDGAAETDPVVDDAQVILHNGNGTHHEEDGPSGQMVEETAKAANTNSSPKKTKKAVKKTTKSRKKDAQGDVVMAS